MKQQSKRLLRKPQDPWVILFHGYGASCEDLYPLAPLLDPYKRFNFFFPQAPYFHHPQWGPCASWFDIDVEKLAFMNQQKNFEEWKHSSPPSLLNLEKSLLEPLKKEGMLSQPFVLGGFSQGAIVSTQLALSSSISPSGMLLFSTSLCNQDKWLQALKSKKSFPYFLSHGLSDPLLDASLAIQWHELLKQNQWKGEKHLFEGGHEIPLSIIKAAASFLDKHL